MEGQILDGEGGKYLREGQIYEEQICFMGCKVPDRTGVKGGDKFLGFGMDQVKILYHPQKRPRQIR